MGRNTKRVLMRFKAISLIRWLSCPPWDRKGRRTHQNGQKQKISHKVMKKESENWFKIAISYQNRTITVDLRKIIAINHPNEGDNYFCVYFDNSIWKVPISEHDRLYKAWMETEITF